MQNLREFVNQFLESDKQVTGYADIVREERYFCAVLFHCMLQDPEGLQRFLDECKVDSGHREVKGVFIEYAMLRDLWNQLETNPDVREQNRRKRSCILWGLERCLEEGESIESFPRGLDTLSTLEFNRIFAVNPSTEKIQSPSQWGIKRICDQCRTDGKPIQPLVKSAIRLKWSFNVKPDIVLELGQGSALCIEAKVESKEGTYIRSKSDRNCLEGALCERYLPFKNTATQRSVQQNVMKNILGYETLHEVFLLKRRNRNQEKGKQLTWIEAFDCFPMPMEPHIRRAMKQIGIE